MSWSEVGQVGGFFVAFCAVIVVPVALTFHRKVIRPLRWVLGVTAADSPTGEEVLPVPQQLALLRKTQLEIMEKTAQLENNGGSSVKDQVRQTHKLAIQIRNTLNQHLVASATNEAAIWKAIAEGISTASAADFAAVAAAKAQANERTRVQERDRLIDEDEDGLQDK